MNGERTDHPAIGHHDEDPEAGNTGRTEAKLIEMNRVEEDSIPEEIGQIQRASGMIHMPYRESLGATARFNYPMFNNKIEGSPFESSVRSGRDDFGKNSKNGSDFKSAPMKERGSGSSQHKISPFGYQAKSKQPTLERLDHQRIILEVRPSPMSSLKKRNQHTNKLKHFEIPEEEVGYKKVRKESSKIEPGSARQKRRESLSKGNLNGSRRVSFQGGLGFSEIGFKENSRKNSDAIKLFRVSKDGYYGAKVLPANVREGDELEHYWQRRRSLDNKYSQDSPINNRVPSIAGNSISHKDINGLRAKRFDPSNVNYFEASPSKSRSRRQSMPREMLNLSVCDVLIIPEIFENITNKETIRLLLERKAKKIFDMKSTSTVLPKQHSKFPVYQSTPLQKFIPVASESVIEPSVQTPAIPRAANYPISPISVTGGAAGFRVISAKAVKREASYKQYLKNEENIRRLNAYVPIAMFLAYEHNYPELVRKLIYYDPSALEKYRSSNLVDILQDDLLLQRLVDSVVQFDESKVYSRILSKQINWDALFSDDGIDSFIRHNRIEYLIMFLSKFSEFLQIQKSISKRTNSKNSRTVTLVSPEKRDGNSPVKDSVFIISTKDESKTGQNQQLGDSKKALISRDKIALVIKKCFESSLNTKLIFDVLKNLGFDMVQIVELLLLSGNEDSLIKIFFDSPQLIKHIDPVKIIELKLYRLLRIYDSTELAMIFKMKSAESQNKKKSNTLFNELCFNIKSGSKIQSLCLMIMAVHITFWDFDNLWRFYQAVNEILRYENQSN